MILVFNCCMILSPVRNVQTVGASVEGVDGSSEEWSSALGQVPQTNLQLHRSDGCSLQTYGQSNVPR